MPIVNVMNNNWLKTDTKKTDRYYFTDDDSFMGNLGYEIGIHVKLSIRNINYHFIFIYELHPEAAGKAHYTSNELQGKQW